MVELSKVIEKAMQVKGVQSVVVNRFQRFGRSAQKELENAQIPLGHLEIALLDNDPGLPERGRITFDMEGGL